MPLFSHSWASYFRIWGIPVTLRLVTFSWISFHASVLWCQISYLGRKMHTTWQVWNREISIQVSLSTCNHHIHNITYQDINNNWNTRTHINALHEMLVATFYVLSIVNMCIIKKKERIATKKPFHSTPLAMLFPFCLTFHTGLKPHATCDHRELVTQLKKEALPCGRAQLYKIVFFFHFEYLFSYSGYLCGKVVYILKVGATRLNLWHFIVIFSLILFCSCVAVLCACCVYCIWFRSI